MTSPALWLCPDQLFDGRLHEGMALCVEAGRVSDLRLAQDLPSGAKRQQVAGLVTPGFLDLQVNGGGDALLNADPTASAMRRMAAAHRRFGTVGILPTVITDAPEVLARAVEAALAARGAEGILGLHIEGPHISIARRGTHSSRFVRPLDGITRDHVARLRAAGIAVMITLAPEAVMPGQVADLVAMGAVVSIGHSDATAAQVRDLLAEGASCFTHLFNAMSPMLNRAPGVTGACINSTADAGIICDGIHVADEMVALAIRARPVADTTFLVSDAMSTVGGSDRFTLYGQEIRLVEGRLVNGEGSLAGAHVTMAESLARLVQVLGVGPEVALRMAVTTPARVIGRPDLAGVVGRRLCDLLVLDADWRVTGGLDQHLPALVA
jgi:N-acetylglucosamine-6-phosphate deacetylase